MMLWLQLALGLLTVPLSAFHMDGALFEALTTYVKGIVTLNGDAASLMIGVPLVYKLHVFLGFTIFFDFAVHPHDPHLEWSRCARLSVPPLSDRALSAHTGESAGTIMSITVNGVTVGVSRWPNPEVAAVRELLRQRAVA